eukprot:gene8394-biopygen87
MFPAHRGGGSAARDQVRTPDRGPAEARTVRTPACHPGHPRPGALCPCAIVCVAARAVSTVSGAFGGSLFFLFFWFCGAAMSLCHNKCVQPSLRPTPEQVVTENVEMGPAWSGPADWRRSGPVGPAGTLGPRPSVERAVCPVPREPDLGGPRCERDGTAGPGSGIGTLEVRTWRNCRPRERNWDPAGAEVTEVVPSNTGGFAPRLG